MAYALLFVLASSIAYLIEIRRRKSELPREFVGIYLGVGAFLLLGILFFSIGRAGSEPHRATRRFEAIGFAVDAASAAKGFELRSAGGTTGAYWSALPPGGRIRVRDEGTDRFAARYAGPPAAVRLDGESLNVPEGGWTPADGRAEFVFGKVRFTLVDAEGRIAVERDGQRSRPVRVRRQITLADFLAKADAEILVRDLRRGGELDPDAAVLLRKTTVERSGFGLLTRSGGFGPEIVGKGRLSVWTDDTSELRLTRESRTIAGTSGPRRLLEFTPPIAFALPDHRSRLWRRDRDGRSATVDLATVDTWATGDGYLLPGGDPARPVVRRATFRRDGDVLDLGGARPSATPVALTDGPFAPVIRISDEAAQRAGEWMLPGLALILGALLAGKGRYEGAGRRAPVAFLAVAALLVVRCVIAFRVSTLLPTGMRETTAGEWREAWTVAKWLAIGGIPIMGWACLAASGIHGEPSKSRMPTKFRMGPVALTFGAGIAYWGALLGGGYLAIREGVFKDSSLHPWLYAPMVLYAVFLAMRAFGGDGVLAKVPERWRGLAVVLPFAPIVLTDQGYVLYALPMAFAYAAVRATDKAGGRWALPCLAAGVAFFLFLPASPYLPVLSIALLAAAAFPPVAVDARRWSVGLVLAALVVGVVPAFRMPEIASGLMRSPAGKVTAVQRLAESQGRLGPAMLDPRVSDSIAASGEGIAQQRWLMDRSLDAGGVGMYRAPLVGEAGLTYPTYLSDAVYATLLVGEHGPLAGWVTIALSTLVGAVFLLSALAAADVTERRYAVRALALVGGFFALVGPYLALANHWLVPFTGLNIPFLGISSKGEGVGTLVLAALATVLVGRPRARMLVTPYGTRIPRSTLIPFLAAGAVPAAWLIGLAIVSVPDARDAKRPFEPDPAAIADLRRRSDRVAALLDGARRTAERADEPLAPPDLERSFESLPAGPRVRRWVRHAFRGKPSTPLVEDDERWLVDPGRLTLGSPFAGAIDATWRGTMTAEGAASSPVVVFGDGRRAVRLIAGAPDRDLRAREPRIGESRAETIRIPGGRLVRDGKTVAAIPDAPGSLRLDGRPHRVRTAITRAATVSGGGQTVALVLDVPETIAEPRWRNGRERRVFRLGDTLPAAYRWVGAADGVTRHADRTGTPGLGEKALRTSIDLGLQADVTARLAEYCRAAGRPTEPTRRPVYRLRSKNKRPFRAVSEPIVTSLVLVESTTGRIRGAVAFPVLDPNRDPASAPGSAGPRDRSRSARDGWLGLPRTVGSASKPITLAALATTLGPAIGELRVDERRGVIDDRYRRLGDLELRRGIGFGDGSPYGPRQPVDMGDMLRDSRTYAALTLGIIGLTSSGEPFGPGSDLVWRGQSRSLALRATAPELFAGRGGDLASGAIAKSRFLRGVRETFGGLVVRPEPTDPKNLRATRFLPFFVPPKATIPLGAIPVPQILDPQSFSFLDGGWVQYAIGGGENRWSPIVMAGHAARLATGRAVVPTLRGEAPEVDDRVAGPLGEDAWRERHIVRPMREVRTLVAPNAIATLARAGLTLEAKTGTIDNDALRRCESLIFTIRRGDTPLLSGYLSLRDTGPQGTSGVRSKNRALDAIAPAIVAYLGSKAR